MTLNTTFGSLSSEEVLEVKAQVIDFYQAVALGQASYFDRHFHHLRAPDWNFPGVPSPPDDSVFIGTSPNELVVGHQRIKDYWAALFPGLGPLYAGGGLPIEKGSIMSGSSAIRVAGCSSEAFKVAWVVDNPTIELRGTVNADQPPPYNSRSLKCRFTAVLQYPARSAVILNHPIQYWMFTQAHLSIGVMDDLLPIG